MTAPHFVTLPSGERINLALLLRVFRREADGKVVAVSADRPDESGGYCVYEGADAAALLSATDALGQPASAGAWESDLELAQAMAAAFHEIDLVDLTVGYPARRADWLRAAAVARRGR